MKKIITITLNPAVDFMVSVPRFVPGEVNRADEVRRMAGGKGVNVSRMLAGYGVASEAAGFLGRSNAEVFESLWAESLITDGFVRVAGETRMSVKIRDEAAGETTDLNFPGFAVRESEAAELLERIRRNVVPGGWFVIAGSLPVNLPIRWISEVIDIIRKGGGRVAADLSGDALQTAVAAGVDVAKPNHHELAEWAGRELADEEAQLAAAREMRAAGARRVIVSRGRHGAFFAGEKGLIFAEAPPAEVAATVGAGDALLAGYLAGKMEDLDEPEAAKLAMVFAWCAVENLARELPGREELQRRMAEISLREIS